MLHVGVLPHHDRWGDVLANLAYVVVDEAHVYRGVFGSHVANVLRRLRRLARIYGAEPQFLLASATIANAGELALALTGEPATVVDRDTSSRAEREIVIWNPPLLDAELGLRASALGDAARLLSDLTSRGLRTICFAKSRRAAELIHRFASERVDVATARRLAPYRAGYTPEQRREIERRLVEGELLGVTATDALELGIDIGLLDCAISVGFPGTVASLRQQWGRAGRRGRGLAVLVASDDALDQFFAREPDALLCAGSRRRSSTTRTRAYSTRTSCRRRSRRRSTRTTRRRSGARHCGAPPTCPSSSTRARATSGRGATTLPRASRCARETLRRSRSSTVRPARSSGSSSATARTRRCTRVPSTSISVSSTSSNRCRSRIASRSSAPHVSTGTRRRRRTPRRRSRRAHVEAKLGVELHFGRVSVTEQVVGYARKAVRDGATLDVVPLLMPETTFETEAVWFCPEAHQLDELEEMPKLLGTLHAAEHSLIALLPLWAMCDRWDIGGLSTNVHYQTGRPTIFVYDGHAGGVGITERGFERFGDWVEDTARLLQRCPCVAGCPSCVQSPKCGNLNEPLDKAGARLLLERMLASRLSIRMPGVRLSRKREKEATWSTWR